MSYLHHVDRTDRDSKIGLTRSAGQSANPEVGEDEEGQCAYPEVGEDKEGQSAYPEAAEDKEGQSAYPGMVS